MHKKRIIKLLALVLWMLVMAGISTLLVAASKKQGDQICRQLVIGMRGGKGMYLDKNDIIRIIERYEGKVLNKSVASIHIAKLERNMELNPWISNAEIYFDSKNALHVFVEERQPIARIFTGNGRSFYIDSSGSAMPLLEKLSARVPVVTGFPGGARWNAKDSSLMNNVKTIASFIYDHPFWNAQVGQIHITTDRKFEMIPVVGDHVIRLGDARDVEEKLNKLHVFYRQVLSKVGFSKYETLDVQFKGQVVAVKKTGASPVDSMKLRKNIDELIVRARQLVGDENMLPGDYAINEQDTSLYNALPHDTVDPGDTDPNPALAQSGSGSRETPSVPIEKPSAKKPKAVMERRQ